MNLESQVCRLEFAKRFKELGVKQESFAYWDEHYTDPFLTVSWPEYGRAHIGSVYSAFTVAELGEMLPSRLELGDKEHPAHRLAFEKQETRWHGTYVCAMCAGKLFSEYAETEVDARAKMLIYLLENKLITV